MKGLDRAMFHAQVVEGLGAVCSWLEGLKLNVESLMTTDKG